ncbi:MBL fold metallo-hydrolase, partial [Nocardiopsis tropica]|nr:MBL fold metallo-hydrolase [Nocardiopsis tropica]
RAAVTAGAPGVGAVVDRDYPAGDAQHRFAAESSVRAQLRYLASRGELPAGNEP